MDYLEDECASFGRIEVEITSKKEPDIVVLTGSKPRHRRFACRLQQEFGERVICWYEISDGPKRSPDGAKGALRHLTKVFKRVRMLSPQKFVQRPSEILRRVYRRLSTSEYDKHKRRLREARARVIEPELPALLDDAHLSPRNVERPNSSEFVSELQDRGPTFLVTLGGPLYRSEILEAPSGLAINQHAGWSPHYKGTATIYWALYHRKLRRLGSTVHVLSKGADAGPILARSFPALTGQESPEECFLRVVVLGTELLINVIERICRKKKLIAFKQPAHVGHTFTSEDMDEDLFRTLRRDFEDGLLSKLLKRRASY